MPLESLSDLYLEELKDLYSAENQIIAALPKMIKAASNSELKKALTDHLEQTRGHVTRLEKICDDLGKSPKGKKCDGMEGVIKDGASLIEEKPEPEVLDAGIAAAAQHVEHYEMAGYGSVRTWAAQLGYDEHAQLLQQTLDEEKEADDLLSQIAETALNVDAQLADSTEEGLADVAPRTGTGSSKGRGTAQPADRDRAEGR